MVHENIDYSHPDSHSSEQKIYKHPDFQMLLKRYSTDPRFIENEVHKNKCIEYLTDLNNWVQLVEKPQEVQAILLTGSFSHLFAKVPDLRPVIRAPFEKGGSDIDVLIIYKTNASGLLRLKWQDANIPERQLHHPEDFIINTRNYFLQSLTTTQNEELAKRIELHVAALTPELNWIALKKYVKHMIRTSTLLWGSLSLPYYGSHREKFLPFKRPTEDSIINLMGGGF